MRLRVETLYDLPRNSRLVVCSCVPLQFKIELPNAYNFVFNAHSVLSAALVPAYLIGAPFLYFHMLKQRAHKLKKSD